MITIQHHPSPRPVPRLTALEVCEKAVELIMEQEAAMFGGSDFVELIDWAMTQADEEKLGDIRVLTVTYTQRLDGSQNSGVRWCCYKATTVQDSTVLQQLYSGIIS